MDPINIIAGINLIATFAANMGGAKKGLKSTITGAKEKPDTYLQKLPLILASVTLLLFILGIFQIGTLEYTALNEKTRIAGLIVYIIFSWVQIWAYRTLGNNYSQEIVLFKNHTLITSGPFKLVRHPQYLSQILMDLGAGFLTLSYLVLPVAVIQIPFIIMRAQLEEKILAKNFKERFAEYKKQSGFLFPFLG